jgi:hypothetical protein
MRFGRRDHESFIGSYDPEHEMPNPDRDPRDRWQSEAYRRNAEDSRWMYRWSPDRIEGRGGDMRGYRGRDMERDIQPRDRYESRWNRGMEPDRGYGMDRNRWDMDRDRGYGSMDRNRWDMDRDRGYGSMDRGYGSRWDMDRDRMMERDRMMDRDGGRMDRGYRGNDWGRDYDRDRDPWSAREAYDRDHFRDDWEWSGGEWDREGRYGRGGGNRY